jgi:hypothetical protein
MRLSPGAISFGTTSLVGMGTPERQQKYRAVYYIILNLIGYLSFNFAYESGKFKTSPVAADCNPPLQAD